MAIDLEDLKRERREHEHQEYLRRVNEQIDKELEDFTAYVEAQHHGR